MYFDIDFATKTVTLDDSGKGELTCKVTNLLKQDVRVQAKLVPEGKTQEAWLSLDAPVKDLKSDGTVTFTARIAAPKGTPAEEYGFHVVVSSDQDPDEKYRESPAVSFKVPAPKPTPDPHPFPWWIVALAAAVLLVGGGVAYLLLRPRDNAVAVGDPCPQKGECGEHLACVTRDGAKKCLRVAQASCESDPQCAYGLCLDSKKCADELAAGADCQGGKCTTGLACVTSGDKKTCLVATGDACAKGTDCVVGRCDGGKCSEVLAQSACASATDCDNRELCVSIPEGQLCLLKGEQTCRSPLDCASKWCREDHRCADEEGRCRDNRDCRPEGFFCKDGRCQRTDGQVCTTSVECASGFCTAGANGRCAQPPVPPPPCPPCTPIAVAGRLRPRFCSQGQCVLFPGLLRQDVGRISIMRELP